MKKQRILLLAACAILLTAAACKHDAVDVLPEAAVLSDAGTERDATGETQTEETMTIRTLPGMIMSDVHVRLWDGDVSPGLRADDAETVKQIIAAQTWGMSYDNISDVWIEAEFVPYAYDTSTGILTAADDRAAKLDDAQRETLNAVIAAYISD